MAVVITVAQQKGGAGKTTLAANLAVAWAETRRVALLDIDPQRSLARWHALRLAQSKAQSAAHPGAEPGAPGGALRTLSLSDGAGWRLAGELERLRRHSDVLLVDSPPHLDSDARRAIRGADLVLVPLQPSLPDLWAAEGTLALAAAERRPVRLVLNRAPSGASRLRDAMAGELAARGLALLPASLGNRSAYAQAFAQGMGVTEAAPRSAASMELRALLAVLEEVLA